VVCLADEQSPVGLARAPVLIARAFLRTVPRYLGEKQALNQNSCLINFAPKFS
jgi:hypothetical protein